MLEDRRNRQEMEVRPPAMRSSHDRSNVRPLQPWRHISRPRSQDQSQRFIRRDSPRHRDGRSGDAGRAAHARAADDNCRCIGSQETCDRLESSAQQPDRIALTVDQRKTAICEVSGKRSPRLVERQINYGQDARRNDARRIEHVARMTHPQRASIDLSHGDSSHCTRAR